MTRLAVTALLLSVVACAGDPVPPPVGDAAYLTATVCVPEDMADVMSASVERWHAAADRVNMRVVVSAPGPECDVVASWEHLAPPKTNAGTVPGAMYFDVYLRGSDFGVEATHELGHLLTGHAHNPDPASVMYYASTTTTITDDDISHIPE